MTTIQDDRHEAARMLLPWYVTGRIEAGDRALVEAHLADCAQCRDELAIERRVAGAVAAMASPAAEGWESMAERLAAREGLARPLPAARPARGRTGGRTIFTPTRLRWLAAAQFAALLVLGAGAIRGEREGDYRALSGDAQPRAGNVLVMFRPEMRETDLRAALNSAGARLVDGPTAANAYVLEVPGGAQGQALATLRRDAQVTMAEPIAQAPAE